MFVDEDSPTSSKSDPETDCDIALVPEAAAAAAAAPGPAAQSGEESRAPSQASGSIAGPWGGERRRRKLPEIPKNKKCKYS